MKTRLRFLTRVITRMGYIAAFFCLGASLILSLFYQPVQASELSNEPFSAVLQQGQGNCGTGYVDKDENAPFSYNGNEIITSVTIKAGSQNQGDACFSYSKNGAQGCYAVHGLGTTSVTVTFVGGDGCKEISHVEFYSDVEPTPTATKSPVPPTPTDTQEAPTPTDTQEAPTPTDTQEAPTPTDTQEPPTPTNTPVDQPTETATLAPTETAASTPTATVTPGVGPTEEARTPTPTNTPEDTPVSPTSTPTLTPPINQPTATSTVPGITQVPPQPTATGTISPVEFTPTPTDIVAGPVWTATNTVVVGQAQQRTPTPVPTLAPPSGPASTSAPVVMPVSGYDFQAVQANAGRVQRGLFNLGAALLCLAFLFQHASRRLGL